MSYPARAEGLVNSAIYKNTGTTLSLVSRPHSRNNKVKFLLGNSIILPEKHTTCSHTRLNFYQRLFLCKDILTQLFLHSKNFISSYILINQIINFRIVIVTASLFSIFICIIWSVLHASFVCLSFWLIWWTGLLYL